MPLLCISLLVLLLLPLSLSCDSKRPLREVGNHYELIVQTVLDNATGSIAILLQNSSCSDLKHKIPSCTSDAIKETLKGLRGMDPLNVRGPLVNIQDVASTLHNLACKMKNLKLFDSKELVRSILISLQCPCLERPTKKPNVKRTTAATKKRRHELRKSKRETRKLCKAKEILSAMTKCYEMLNTILTNT